VSGCSTHGGLLGGYVLGSLEPAEMDEMRRHVADCPDCGPEARELASLPSLLDRIEPSDVPPPTLSPGVEEAVLDRFARERRRAPKPRRRRLTVPRLAALGAAVAAAVVLAVVLIGGEEATSPAYATASLEPVAPSSSAEGKAYVSEVPAGTRVRLRAGGLRDGRMYELWCVREDGRWVSGGTFRVDRRGRARVSLTSAARPGDYEVMLVTRRSERKREGERGEHVLRGRVEY
jgi:anti-sigma-K factor RskA